MAYLRTISSLQRGDHACLIYDDPGRRDRLVTEVVAAGLDAGERVVFLSEEAKPPIVAEFDRGVAEGRLEVRSAEEAYLVDGAFDADRIIESFRSERDAALAAGFAALRAVGGPPEELRRNGHSGELTEYERRVNELFEDRAMVGVCAYDSRSTDPRALLAVAEAHPVVLFAVGPHPRLRVEAVSADCLEVGGWLDLTTLGGLVGPLAEALAASDEVQIDLADVEFVDLAGVRLFVEASDILPERGGALVLRAAPDWLPTVLRILEYSDREGLVLA